MYLFFTKTASEERGSTVIKIFNLQNLKYLHWDTLEERRKNARLTVAYMIINGHLIIHPKTMPKQRLSRKSNETKVGYHNQLVELPCTIEVAQKTLFFSTPILWNDSVPP